MEHENLQAPGYRASPRDRAIAAAQRVIRVEPAETDAYLVAAMLLCVLGVRVVTLDGAGAPG